MISGHLHGSPNRLLFSRLSPEADLPGHGDNPGSDRPDLGDSRPNQPDYDEELYIAIVSENSGVVTLAAAAEASTRMAICLSRHEECLQNSGEIYHFSSPISRSGRILFTKTVQIKLKPGMQATLLSATTEFDGFENYKRIQFKEK